jgi:hypothetical protein
MGWGERVASPHMTMKPSWMGHPGFDGDEEKTFCSVSSFELRWLGVSSSYEL